MNDVLSVAMGKIAAPSKARSNLLPGTYNVDSIVRVSGTLRVGENYERAPTVSVPLKETLALFIAYSGITATHATTALTRALGEAIAKTGTGQGSLAETMPIVEQTMNRVQSEVIDNLPRVNVSGRVDASLNIEEVEKVVP